MWWRKIRTDLRLHFARHGESQANLLHEVSNRGLRHPLTPKGRTQAVALAERLQPLCITRVYSSPLLRAIETSVIVADRLGVDYEIVDALREYDCGIAEGRADEVGWQLWHELFDAWVVHQRHNYRLEGGESFNDIRDRFVPFVEDLVKRYGDGDAEIVCVAHGGVYWVMLPLVLQNVDHALIAKHGFDYTVCVVAELRPEGLVCVEWNGHAVG